MRALLVANDGGHLAQLRVLISRMPFLDAPVWASVRSAQSESVLADQEVYWLRRAPSHNPRLGIVNTASAARILSVVKPEIVISTGSSLAVSFLPLAASFGVSAHYIESATRLSGPSLAGRLVALHPRVHLYTQNRVWASTRWPYRGDVFDSFESFERKEENPEIRRVVVTVGTTEGYPFARLLRQAASVIPESCEVFWQTGDATIADDLGIAPCPSVGDAKLRNLIRNADVVISHAGTGAALTALEEGRVPILVPRRREHAEHIDDHQVEIAYGLARRRLAVAVEAEMLSDVELQKAARLRATTIQDRREFRLDV